MAAAVTAKVAANATATTGEAHKFIVRATYRHLFRAMGVAFKGIQSLGNVRHFEITCSHVPGDFDTDRSAREFARKSFREDPMTEPGTQIMAQRIEHAQGVTKILKENIVQGKLAEKKPDTYQLRFTKDTQRLDNEDTRKLKGTTKSFKEIKNAQF
jgi:complex III assembly factor LYRM7